jgi:hypothetical protein
VLDRAGKEPTLQQFSIEIFSQFLNFEISNLKPSSNGKFITIFLGAIVISVIFTIRLLIPIRVAYLEVSDRYSTSLRNEYEKKFLSSDLSEEKVREAKDKIDKYLKASYIAELSESQEINQKVFVSKSSFYYRALIYGLAAIIPYVICIGFHLSRKDDKVQKVHLVYQKKIVNCILSSNFYA